MSWYWWISIIIYLMGASFSVGVIVTGDDNGWLMTLFLIFVWPVAIILGLTQMLMDLEIFHRCWNSTITKFKTWHENRKEDKLFYEKHLDNKFERSGIKFDENGDIVR